MRAQVSRMLHAFCCLPHVFLPSVPRAASCYARNARINSERCRKNAYALIFFFVHGGGGMVVPSDGVHKEWGVCGVQTCGVSCLPSFPPPPLVS